MANKKVKDVLETAASETKAAADRIAKTAEPAVKAAREAIKDVSEKAEPVIAKAKTAAKNAGKQVAAVFVPSVYVQYENSQYDVAELVERCKDDFRGKYSSGLIRSCKLYIKPEDHTVYYVINDIEDRIDL